VDPGGSTRIRFSPLDKSEDDDDEEELFSIIIGTGSSSAT
jgi:hypothetical protein